MHSQFFALLLTLSGASAARTSAAEEDRVVDLPGAPADLGYDMFAGYVHCGRTWFPRFTLILIFCMMIL